MYAILSHEMMLFQGTTPATGVAWDPDRTNADGASGERYILCTSSNSATPLARLPNTLLVMPGPAPAPAPVLGLVMMYWLRIAPARLAEAGMREVEPPRAAEDVIVRLDGPAVRGIGMDDIDGIPLVLELVSRREVDADALGGAKTLLLAPALESGREV